MSRPATPTLDWIFASDRWRTQPALTPAQQAADPFGEGYPDVSPCDGCGAADSEDCSCGDDPRLMPATSEEFRP